MQLTFPRQNRPLTHSQFPPDLANLTCFYCCFLSGIISGGGGSDGGGGPGAEAQQQHYHSVIKKFSPHPYFDFDVPRNVTTRVGQTAFINCRVEQIGDKWVSAAGAASFCLFPYTCFKRIHSHGGVTPNGNDHEVAV